MNSLKIININYSVKNVVFTHFTFINSLLPIRYKIPVPAIYPHSLSLTMKEHFMLLLSMMTIGWTLPVSHKHMGNIMENIIIKVLHQDNDNDGSGFTALLKYDASQK